jgi:hypothetical protein
MSPTDFEEGRWDRIAAFHVTTDPRWATMGQDGWSRSDP